MRLQFKKVDVIIVVILIIVAGLFLYKAGYIEPFPPEPVKPPPDPDNQTIQPPSPTPPASFTPSYRRDVSPEDEGVHFDKIRICREWWYYSAVFNGENTDLKDWVVAISFNHMARGDLLATAKPDLLVVTLFSPEGEVYGGMINKERGLGILKAGTLIASSPGVNVEFEDSWAEGEYPNWHVHAEDQEIDTEHVVVIDLDFVANSLPIWTVGNRAFDKSKSSIADYLFTGLDVSGTVIIDDEEYRVNGTGHHEHAWSPNIVTKGTINGWDWFHMTLDNGWTVYLNNYYPTPQVLSTKTSRLNPFGTVLITTDNGETFTELRNVDLKITREDDRIFPLVKMPAAFSLDAQPSINPLYAVSQSFLWGTYLQLDTDMDVEHVYNKVWRFPTFVGMKLGFCSINGTLSWTDNDGEHTVPIDGHGISWSMRALF